MTVQPGRAKTSTLSLNEYFLYCGLSLAYKRIFFVTFYALQSEIWKSDLDVNMALSLTLCQAWQSVVWH